MKDSIILGLLLTLGVISQAQGQTILYKSASGQLFSPQQVDSLIEAKNKRIKSSGLTFTKQVKNIINRPDTVIYEFGLQGTTTGVRANREKFIAFIGKPLPPFVLPDISGKSFSSTALAGKPLVINMWFTSCAPCISEMPALNRIQAAKANSDVVFLAITYESGAKVNAFLQKHAFTFHHLTEAQTYCNQFTNSYPISVFINRQGIITSILEGMPNKYNSVTKELTNSVDDTEFYAALKQIE